MTRIAIVGGGISGLAAAWTLAGQVTDAEVIVLEGAQHVGGKLQTATVAGLNVDVGAEAMLARRPEGVGLVSELGLDDQVIAPLTTSARVRAGGVLHPLPARTMLGIPADLDAARASGLLGAATLERVAAEPDAAPLPPLTDDVAVGVLVRERLGDEVADRLVEPLLGGVYAGRADALSLHATMPAVFAHLTQHGGSLVRAAQAVLMPPFPTPGPKSGPDSGHTVGKAGFASLRGGLGRLPRALADSGRFTVRTGTTVRELTRTATGFRLVTGPVPVPEVIEADAVVIAVPAAKAARLLRTVAPSAAADLAEIEYASMVIATFAFRDVQLPDGSGLLVSAREGLAVKGVTISSHKWPLEAGNVTVLRASIGRAGAAQELQREDDDLLALARRDLRSLLGLTAEPVDAVLTRWGGGLPQYAVGHVERVARIRASVDAVPGLAVCGAAYDGVGIPACIGSAQRAAAHVADALVQRGQ
jgi:oxygen-dependent protoporphyrinogen oxidase